ncbi:MAG: FHA domain-containing protein [Myxococcota bacterium]
MPAEVDATRPLRAKDGALALMVVAGESVQWVPLDQAGPLVLGRSPSADVYVEDGSLSRRHACVHVVDDARIEVEDLGSRNGTIVGGRTLGAGERVALPLDALVELGSTVLALRRLAGVPEDAIGPYGRTRRRVLAMAPSEPVLLLGEAGTGKTALAQAALPGAEVVACGDLRAADLLTWTTSVPRVLQRVTEAPRTVHAQLGDWLAAPSGPVVVTSRVDPATLARTRQADPRLVRALPSTVLVVPTLGECGPEVVPLARTIVASLGPDLCGATFSKEARAALATRAWPGNVAQLREVIEAAAAAAGGGVIDASHLEAHLASLSAEARERLRILAALRDCAGNQTSAAKQLGMTRRALVYRLDKYGIERPRKAPRDG